MDLFFFSFLYPSIKYSASHGRGCQYLNDAKTAEASKFVLGGLDRISVLAGVTMESMGFRFALL